MKNKGIVDQTNLVLLILIPSSILISAWVSLAITDGFCKSLPEHCGYYRSIAYALISAEVIGAILFFKYKFF